MASARIKKKKEKMALKRVAIKQLQDIENLNLQNSEIDKEIEELKKKIKKKKKHLAELRAELERISELSERNLLNTFNQKISIADLQAYAEKARYSGDNYNAAEHWAAIKRYNELVDIGLIPKGSIHDKYDAVEYLQNILSPEQVNRINIAAEKKLETLRAKSAKRNENIITFDW